MNLKSSSMNLRSSELSWLPWFGKTGKIAMGWACHLNRSHYAAVEQTFEGIAATRVRILTSWTQTQWEHLAGIAAVVGQAFPAIDTTVLHQKRLQASDMSEIFVIDREGKTLTFTHAA